MIKTVNERGFVDKTEICLKEIHVKRQLKTSSGTRCYFMLAKKMEKTLVKNGKSDLIFRGSE